MCALVFSRLKCYLSLVENQVRFMRSRCGSVFFTLRSSVIIEGGSFLLCFSSLLPLSFCVVVVVSFSLVKEDKIIIERSYRFFCCSVRILAELCLACLNLLLRPLFLHGTCSVHCPGMTVEYQSMISSGSNSLCVCSYPQPRLTTCCDVLFMLSGSMCSARSICARRSY